MPSCHMHGEPGSVPDAIMFFPAPGPDGVIEGRDGRSFVVPSVETLNAAQKSHGQDIPIDLEHATEAWWGDCDKKALGWVKSATFYTDEEGAVWAPVEWNEYGQEAISKKAYRYFSPAFMPAPQTTEIDGVTVVDYDLPRVVVYATSGGLTNRPNLHMPALNSREDAPGENLMDTKTLCALLGITAGGSEKDIAAAIQSGRASLNAFGLDYTTDKAQAVSLHAKLTTPDPTKYISAELHATEVAARKDAEKKLVELRSSQHKAEIDTWVSDSTASGRMLPCQVDHYRKMAEMSPESFAVAKDIVANAPEVAGEAPKPKPVDGSDDHSAIPADVVEIAARTGMDPKELHKRMQERKQESK